VSPVLAQRRGAASPAEHGPVGLHPSASYGPEAARVATPGDVLLHVRASRMDLCFELAARIMARLGGAVTTAD